jgi:Rha family phage regulatory protein
MAELVVMGKDGVPITTSLMMAEVFGERHSNLLQRIMTLNCSDEFRKTNFYPVQYTDGQGEKRPMYGITRDGFVVLGLESYDEIMDKDILKYINAFSAMHNLRLENGTLNQGIRKDELQKLYEDGLYKKINAEIYEFNRRFSYYESFKLRTTAQTLGFSWIGSLFFPSALRQLGILKPDVNRHFLWYYYENKPYQQYIDKGYFEVKKMKISKYTPFIKKDYTLVTGKGIEWLREILK